MRRREFLATLGLELTLVQWLTFWGSVPFGVAVYFVDREGALKSKEMIDDTGMDCEDLIVGDFNGDKKPDIVASGRATRNLKIYWNETGS